MALRYGYFDSDIIGVDDEGMPIFDRAETSDLFALLFAKLVSDGVLAQPADCFRVVGTGSGMKVEIQPGFGMVKGHFAYNDEKMPLDIQPAPKKYGRIDRVVLRCNYLERMVEIIVKTGTEAAKPVPPALIRPSAGDYYELCLAEIRLSARQEKITQSSITDRRPDSSVCGYITQLIDHLDTDVFFTQFNAFYREFVDKSEASYAQFTQMAQDAYQKFNTDIMAYFAALKKDSQDTYDNLTDLMNNCYNNLSQLSSELYGRYRTEISDYVAQLEAKGDSDLAEITQQLLDFRNTNEAAFLAWFDRIKNMLGTTADGELLNGLEEVTGRLEDTEEMLFTGVAAARIETSDGYYITADTGQPLLAQWPVYGCGRDEVEEMIFNGTDMVGIETSDGDYITDHTGDQIMAGWPICK